LGKYNIKALLGSGAFGRVYLVEEILGGRVLRESALKVYSPEASAVGLPEGMLWDCTLPARVLASAAPLAIKAHFVPIYDYGSLDTPDGPCAFVCMELIRTGDTLESVMRRNERVHALPEERVILGYMTQFFEALALAHDQNVLHRDIKSNNVMISDGSLKLVDFGMGALLDRPDAFPLRTTLAIYAPENFTGVYTAASDIYQAGLMFYRMYTGWSPFARETPPGEQKLAFARRLRLEFYFRSGACFPDTKPSPMLDAVLRRCLEYSQLARFQTAGEVLQALEGTYALDALAASALENGDLALAETQALGALTQGGHTPDSEADIRLTLGDVYTARESWGAAMKQYKLVYQIDERSQIYFHAPARFNALVERIANAYAQDGQEQSAQIWLNRRRNR
jgi:eukaryotic-like serine/threonine-protein kinase